MVMHLATLILNAFVLRILLFQGLGLFSIRSKSMKHVLFIHFFYSEEIPSLTSKTASQSPNFQDVFQQDESSMDDKIEVIE